jgi:phosphoenolpyruvate carboxykinase (ATP)
MVLHPAEYAQMLGERLEHHGAGCWLVNTGWTGGPFGTGSRMKLEYTRTMLNAALEGKLDDVQTMPDPVFGLNIPVHVPGVPSEILNPRETWPNPENYDRAAAKLASMFRDNFERYADHCTEDVLQAGP